jgi:long-chain fatty acid transport protein
VEPILGLIWSPIDKLSIGVSLRQTSVMSESVKVQNNCLSTSTSTPCASSYNASPTNSSTKRSYPLTLSLGVAYFPSDRLLYSADFVYYQQTNGVASSHLDNYARTKVSTWNASAGLEYYYTDRWALRGGLYTNNANTPRLSNSGVDQPENVNYYGLSLSLSHFTRNSSITGGFSYSAGNGKAQVISSITNIQDVMANSLTVFLSTSYSY